MTVSDTGRTTTYQRHGDMQMKKIVAAACCSIILLAACGDDGDSKSAGSAAFCANMKSLGSLSKGTSDAMAMQPADGKKDNAI